MNLITLWFGGKCTSSATLHEKTAIITGSNTGIGKETAKDFVKRGARVILACRNLEKANKAAEDVRKVGSGEVIIRHLDLSSFKSIRKFAEEILDTEERIDILVNNAAAMVEKGRTEDNFDLVFGINQLGPFLLTHLLLDKIKQSAPARIINVASDAHYKYYGGNIDWDDINLDLPGNYGIWKAYAQSKLCNVLFSRELAEKLEGTGVNVYSLHPGFTDTELFRNIPYILRPFASLVFPFVAKTLEQGAQTTIYCAVSEEAGNESGLYYCDCKEKTPSFMVTDGISPKRLWDMNIRMCGLDLDSDSDLFSTLEENLD